MISSEMAGSLQRISLAFVPFMFGIVCHEVAHGWVANKLGDPTAKNMGRLTLNPVQHLDPAGALMFVVTAMLTPFAFGWAKPVPVVFRNLRNPRRDMMLVSIAGPLANLGVAILCLLILYASTMMGAGGVQTFMEQSAVYGVYVNLVLMWLNLLPIPPLDGGRIVTGLLPRDLAMRYASLERYGMLVLIALLFLGVFKVVLFPLVDASAKILFSLL